MDYFHITQDKQDLLAMSSLGLAYLGDAVYEVMVRGWLCLHGKLTPGKLHRAALAYVAAPRQAEMTEKLLPLLSEAGVQTGAQRQPPFPAQGRHPPGVPDSHRVRSPVWLAVFAGGDGAAQPVI